MKNVGKLAQGLLNLASLLVVIIGLVQLYNCKALQDRQTAAAVENILLPSYLENIRAMRAGLAGINDDMEKPQEVTVAWHKKVRAVIVSRAFEDVLANNAELKPLNMGFDQKRFVDLLTRAGDASDETLFRNVTFQIYMKAAGNEASASLALIGHMFGAFAIIVGGLVLMLFASQLSSMMTIVRIKKSQLTLA